MFFQCLFGKSKDCGQPGAQPLSECCGCRRVKVCRISGDRNTCGRMASLGVLPGVEMELLCHGQGRRHRRQQCMVKVNGGGTFSLDALTAASIFVEPA